MKWHPAFSRSCSRRLKFIQLLEPDRIYFLRYQSNAMLSASFAESQLGVPRVSRDEEEKFCVKGSTEVGMRLAPAGLDPDARQLQLFAECDLSRFHGGRSAKHFATVAANQRPAAAGAPAAGARRTARSQTENRSCFYRARCVRSTHSTPSDFNSDFDSSSGRSDLGALA